LASYFLSRTIVPTMAKYLLRGENHEAAPAAIRWRASRSALRKPSRTFAKAIAAGWNFAFITEALF